VEGEVVWSSLEIWKLIVSISTPLIVLIFGYLINKNLKTLEQKHWENRTVTEWRIKVFDEVSPQLNDIYCYLLRIGNWKELKPFDIVQRKRSLDKKIHTSAALFSSDLTSTYDAFMNTCFSSYRGPGKNAAIRMEKTKHESAAGVEWEKDWDDLFVRDDECAIEADVEMKYGELMSLLSEEVGIGLKSENHADVRNGLFGWWRSKADIVT